MLLAMLQFHGLADVFLWCNLCRRAVAEAEALAKAEAAEAALLAAASSAGGSPTGTVKDAFEELKAMAAAAVAAGKAPKALQLALPPVADPQADKRRMEVHGS
jgi:glutamate synthase (NADPH/NADH)